MAQRARHLFVSGRVQGVAFRWYARERAEQLGLRGWVRNLDDGRVEVWIEGDAESLEEMTTWLGKGPQAARVAELEVRESELRGYAKFELDRTHRI